MKFPQRKSIIFFFILLLIQFSSHRLFCQNCSISSEIFDVKVSCTKKYRSKIYNAIELYIDKMNSIFLNPSSSCLPTPLSNLIENRFCLLKPDGTRNQIQIECKSIDKENVKYDCYGRRDKVFTPGAFSEGHWRITFNTKLLKESTPEQISYRLFHEMIHISEGLYGFQKYNNPNISKEDFTYTCTKACFPNAVDCNQDESACIPCNQYKLPSPNENCKFN